MKLRSIIGLGALLGTTAFIACTGEINPQPLPPNSPANGATGGNNETDRGGSSTSSGGFGADASNPAPAADAGGLFDGEGGAGDASSDGGTSVDAGDAGSTDAATD